MFTRTIQLARHFALAASFLVGPAAFAGGTNDLVVMAYNVENLFDTAHDEGKNDWEYTPAHTAGKDQGCRDNNEGNYLKQCLQSDWTPARLQLKLDQIKRVVTSAHPDGKLPDVLFLEEVENDNVIKMLADHLGYSSFSMTHSPDERGVDVAILYNTSKTFAFVKSTEHELKGPEFEHNTTRNILEAEFLIDGKLPLVLFANHWPSQNNPVANRMATANKLKALMLDRQARATVISAGDFNVVDGDVPHPFNDALLTEGKVHDVHGLYHDDSVVRPSQRVAMPQGSYFYGKDNAWNMLDHFFLDDNALEGSKGLKARLASYLIHAPDFAKKSNGTPMRYDHKASTADRAGFSDHFPILIKVARTSATL